MNPGTVTLTLDPDHCEEADILPMEFVDTWNKNSGARISTYVILGGRGHDIVDIARSLARAGG